MARNEFALQHNRKPQPVTELRPNDYIGSTDFEQILKGRFTAPEGRDVCLGLSNRLGRIEHALQKDNRYRGLVQLDWLNAALAIDGLEKVSVGSGRVEKFDLIECGTAPSAQVESGPLVSVLLPAYNSEAWITTAIDSLLNQTWKNLEVLVVDDQSTDNTLEIAKSYETRDARVRVFQNIENSGPYVARNLALQNSKGTLITVHDADDWSHPRKVERQVKHLLDNPQLIANTSQMVRVNPTNLQFLSAANKFIRLNYSSLMFRKAEVVSNIGYWDSVRFGADSEFIARLETAFGESAIAHLDSGLLSLVRSVESSLTSGGVADKLTGARKLYKRLFTQWHKECESNPAELYLAASGPRKFVAPRKSLGLEQIDKPFDLVLVDDLSDLSAYSLIKLLETRGLLSKHFAYLHVPNPLLPEAGEARHFAQRTLDYDWVNLRLIFEEYGDSLQFKANRTLVSATALAEKYTGVPRFASTSLEVVFQTTDQVRDYRPVLKNCVSVFGSQPDSLVAVDEHILEALSPLKESGWVVRLL